MSVSPRPALLLAHRVPAAMRERIGRHYDVLGPFDASWHDAIAALPRADANRVAVIVQWGNMPTTREIIESLPALALVCCTGSGYEGVDLPVARARGIVVAHSPGANASAVADLAVGLLVANVRGIARGDAFVRRGEWTTRNRVSESRGLTGLKVGIWGLGAIGAKIASRCEAFEMEVAYHGRTRRADVGYPFHATLVDLARWADALMVAVRAGPDNRHAIDAEVLAALGPEGTVVNIARGSVIDEAALVRALRDGVIAGAALDVFEREPDVPAELRAMPQVVLTPHLGGDTADAQRAMREAVLTNIETFAATGAAATPVGDAPRSARAAD